MEKDKLKEVILDQIELFNRENDLISRDINLDYYIKGGEIVVISGIRRCGKSSLLKLIAKKRNKNSIYINFDDIRLSNFNINNFSDIEDIVYEIFKSNNIDYYLDEIQNVKNWEKWVNNLYNKDIKVFVTGSNSNLLSSEISTYLTGRNKVITLSPFSFKEFLRYKDESYDLNLLSTSKKRIIRNYFENYFILGGFPLIIRQNDIDLSKQYFEDILNKDILYRYRIRESKELKDMILFLFSNTGGIYSYSTLKKISQIQSLSTIKNYIEYFENVFLVSQIQKFDYSIKKQKLSSSKVYVLDNSFLKTIAFNFIETIGNRLENLVFIELKRRYENIYYHLKKYECDFIIKDKQNNLSAIQVCKNLGKPESPTSQREIRGLLDACKSYDLDSGLILTYDEEGKETIDGINIIIKPIWKWLLE